jgi:hypothetical protein
MKSERHKPPSTHDFLINTQSAHVTEPFSCKARLGWLATTHMLRHSVSPADGCCSCSATRLMILPAGGGGLRWAWLDTTIHLGAHLGAARSVAILLNSSVAWPADPFLRQRRISCNRRDCHFPRFPLPFSLLRFPLVQIEKQLQSKGRRPCVSGPDEQLESRCSSPNCQVPRTSPPSHTKGSRTMDPSHLPEEPTTTAERDARLALPG